MHRHALTDQEWERLQAVLPKRRSGPEAIRGDRLFVDAVVYRAKTGMPWRDLPERFGPWKTVYNRFTRWAQGLLMNHSPRCGSRSPVHRGRVMWRSGGGERAHGRLAGGRHRTIRTSGAALCGWFPDGRRSYPARVAACCRMFDAMTASSTTLVTWTPRTVRGPPVGEPAVASCTLYAGRKPVSGIFITHAWASVVDARGRSGGSVRFASASTVATASSTRRWKSRAFASRTAF